jgi:hypothetical protein
MIAASIGDCPVRHGHGETAKAPTAPPAAADFTSHQADDGTMAWTTAVAADNSQTFSLMLKQDGTMREVLHAGAAKPGG